MLQHLVRLANLTDPDLATALLDAIYTDMANADAKTLRNVERFVTLTVLLFAFLLLLNGLKKLFAKVWLIKIVSWACYTILPVLLSYTLGLMGGITMSSIGNIWSVFLLFVYASFDNRSAFSLDERNGRLRIFIPFLANFVFILLLVYYLSFKSQVLPILLVFLIVLMKVVERMFALAYAAFATQGIKKNMRKMINYMNKDEGVGVANYLVGARYSKSKGDVIVEGISIEDVWGCKGRLLSSESGGGDRDGKLKDTCLSFALFWLLLGKVSGYRLYKGESRNKAWKLVHDGLLARKLGENQRVFRVIEEELNFLQDYFYSKYMVFYLHGFYSKLCIFAFPIMFWWFTFKAVDYNGDNSAYVLNSGVNPHENPIPTVIVILVIFVLEVIQLIMLIASRWFKVALLSFYVKKKMFEKRNGLFGCCFEKFVASICRISQCSNTKPWKKELDQYSLLDSCTSFGVENNFLQELVAVFGIPGLPKQGRSLGKSVALSENLKSALVLSLQTNGPKLSNGVASLRRNEVEEGLSWACKLECDIEIILVWHIATRICEMRHKSQQNSKQSTEDFKMATCLSKYCAYLLLFSPSLLHVPLLEAEVICNIAIDEARELFKKPSSPCGFVEDVDKCKKLNELLSDNEAGARRATTIRRGAKLGEDLLLVVKDEGRRWKILSEFWAEMILFLAPSNNNEMAHVEKLAEGGEFITHLWALLIHAGIVDRETIHSVTQMN